MNIVQFKLKLVEDLVGKTVDDLFGNDEEREDHTPVHIQGEVRSRCAFCALLSRVRRTRYKCLGCGVPLCSIGSGKVDDDCFTIAHETEDRRQLVCTKYLEMQKRNTKHK
jgi:hypothetical protein